MGRGLSALQKTILLRAISNNRREYGCDLRPIQQDFSSDRRSVVDVFSCEIAADHFGWPLPCRNFYDSEIVDGKAIRARHRICHRPNGSTSEQANRVHASISRALKRLEERGLGYATRGVYSRWSGFILNAEGVEVSQQLELSVNLVT